MEQEDGTREYITIRKGRGFVYAYENQLYKRVKTEGRTKYLFRAITCLVSLTFYLFFVSTCVYAFNDYNLVSCNNLCLKTIRSKTEEQITNNSS